MADYTDFESENPYAKGSFDIKGHVIVISILAATLRIYLIKTAADYIIG